MFTRVALVVFAVVLAACGPETPAPTTKADLSHGAPRVEVVKLGFAAPLTGPQAHYGKEMQNGVILALEEINASNPVIGGHAIRFELLSEDDQADPKQGPQVAQKLVDAGIRGMLGHFNSGTSIPASKVYADAAVPQIAMATAPAYTTNGYKTTFRAMTNDVQQGAAMGRFAVDKLGVRRIVVIDDRSAYGQGLADEFEKAVRTAGGEILRREYVTDKATDFAAVLTAAKSAAPDAIFFGGADAQAGPMARQLRQLGVEAKFLGGEMVKSANFISLAGPAAEGAMASLAGLPLASMPGGSTYQARYTARFNAPVEVYSPYAYDATQVLVAAMRRADSTDPRRYIEALAASKHAGVTSSEIAYDERGDLVGGTITVYRVRDGKWEAIESAGK